MCSSIAATEGTLRPCAVAGLATCAQRAPETELPQTASTPSLNCRKCQIASSVRSSNCVCPGTASTLIPEPL
eukprot:5616957-Alexandrium_andersonii.AAC.1